jgi:hypothetical protein
MARTHRAPARAHQHEAAGPVSVLDHSRRDAALSEKSGLLISGHTRDRNPAGIQRLRRVAERRGRGQHFREHRPRHAEEAEKLVVPRAAMDVEEQRARGVGDVGHVAPTAGELPDEPTVDRAECETAALCRLAHTGHVIEDPLKLGAAEIRVGHESGFRGEHVREAALAQRVAHARGAPVLPHDRIADRRAGRAVPDERRLALIGNADRRHVGGAQPRARQRFGRDGELRRPDVGGIVLDPARPRKDLSEFLLRDRAHTAAAIEHDRARARRALVEGEDAGQTVSVRP